MTSSKDKKKKPHGQIRQSQVVMTVGPGSMFDLPNQAVIIGGLEYWTKGDEVHEPRLLAKLKDLLRLSSLVLHAPPPADDDPESTRKTGIDSIQFPEWFITQSGQGQETGSQTRSRRLIHRTSLTGKSKFIDEEKDVLQEMMEELAAYLPGAKEVLIDERDIYLATRVFQADGKKIVAVVGAGHLSGIARHIQALSENREAADLSSLDKLPERRWTGKVLPWTIPAIILALFVLGVIRAGWNLSLAMFGRWVLIHGGLAAVGSLIAWAHPLTILIAFVGAPIGTFNPFGKIGLFTGAAEAYLRKPRVRDLEGLAEDVGTFKGFYTNRVTHILIVFFMSTLGAAIGNIISIPFLTALLRGAR